MLVEYGGARKPARGLEAIIAVLALDLVLTGALRRHPGVIVARVPMPLDFDPPGTDTARQQPQGPAR